MKICELGDRSLVRIAGEDARTFLQGLVTCEVEGLKTGELAFGGLLSPQGKILFDFFLIASTDGFIADVDASMRDDFIRRLMFYRLRAKVDLEPMDQRIRVYAIYEGENLIPDELVDDGLIGTDPRLPAMGLRAYLRRAPDTPTPGSVEDYHQQRIKLGMPEGGKDYTFGDAFPHEVLMDQFAGVDFSKGCYVGQEVVSRMQHRGTARKRIIKVTSVSGEDLPATGAEILANGRTAGNLASVAGSIGLALVRLDRVAETIKAEGPIHAASVPVNLSIQDWVNFSWPETE